MKVRLERDMETGAIFEYGPGEADWMEGVEVPDEVVMEWRVVRARLAELEEYLDGKMVEQARKVQPLR